jgi:hypothetical protein
MVETKKFTGLQNGGLVHRLKVIRDLDGNKNGRSQTNNNFMTKLEWYAAEAMANLDSRHVSLAYVASARRDMPDMLANEIKGKELGTSSTPFIHSDRACIVHNITNTRDSQMATNTTADNHIASIFYADASHRLLFALDVNGSCLFTQGLRSIADLRTELNIDMKSGEGDGKGLNLNTMFLQRGSLVDGEGRRDPITELLCALNGNIMAYYLIDAQFHCR